MSDPPVVPAVLVAKVGQSVVVTRADGSGDLVWFTTDEWEAWLADLRLVDLDTDRLPEVNLPGGLRP